MRNTPRITLSKTDSTETCGPRRNRRGRTFSSLRERSAEQDLHPVEFPAAHAPRKRLPGAGPRFAGGRTAAEKVHLLRNGSVRAERVLPLRVPVDGQGPTRQPERERVRGEPSAFRRVSYRCAS